MNRTFPVVALLATVSSAFAADPSVQAWPQFRGPNGSGIGEGARPPARFGPGTNQTWKVPVPWSASSPIVWNDRIFLTTFEDGQLQTRAHDRASGRLLWTRGVKPGKLEAFHRTDGSPAASSPATDGRRVVSYFGSFGLLCHDLDGKELWRMPLPVALSGGSYGTGTSPVIMGDAVILNRDQDLGSSLLAVDLATGRKRWETPRPDALGSHGTPVFWQNGDHAEVVHPGSVTLKGYDLATGAERWQVPGVAAFACTTPVVAHGTLYFAAWAPGKVDSSLPFDWPSYSKAFDKNGDGKVDPQDFDPVSWDFMRGIDADRDGSITEADLAHFRGKAAKAENVLLAVRAGGTRDISQTHVPWKFGRGLPYVPSALHWDGRIYLVKDGGLMTSVDAGTGKPFYAQERLGSEGGFYASPVAADGRIFVASLKGRLSVVRAGGEKPEVLHEADFGERIFATPALVGTSVYVRTEKHLYAFGPTPTP